MEAKNKRILEALQMQPLSEEEKASRHILGRLYGPIATTKEKTRNGRGYNKELWERALADEIFKEKVANKSLFLELGHPLDREETDMEKVCACIPEMPKIVDGDLYAYVDILDTNNGRLLKTLCDYGFVPGISSRGSGDIMANDEVDPETFFLETWDIVQLPAVKKARLNVCESLGKKTLTMALRESMEKASDQEKAEMKDTLNKLNISIGEELDTEVPFAPDPVEDDIIEELDADVPVAPGPDESDDILLEKAGEEEEEIEETEVEEDSEEETEEPVEEEETEEAEGAYTVGDMISQLKDYEKKLDLEFKPIVIEDKEYEITALEFDDSEEGKVVVNINYNIPEMEEDNTLPEEENPEVEVEVSSDAEVKGLKEDLEKYKSGFMRVSELASKASALNKEVKSLKEQLEVKTSTIKDLQTKITTTTRLTESANAEKAKVKALTERLVSVQTEAEEAEKALRSKLEESNKTARNNAAIAKKYKNQCTALIERYVATKANMLGVKPSDITSRLAENYTLDDIDQVCESLLNMGRPAFGLGLGKPKVTINESKVATKKSAPIDSSLGYDIDDDLLILAGLK